MSGGVRMTKKKWATLGAEVQSKVDTLTELYAGQIEGSAAAAAPYKYGVLRESIQVAAKGASLAKRKIVVGANYGIYQHEGTGLAGKRMEGPVMKGGSRGIEPNPFLADAVEFWRDDYLQAIAMVIPRG